MKRQEGMEMEAKHFDSRTFKETLSNLSVSRQRQVGARFIEQVLDLAGDARLHDVVRFLSRGDFKAEELEVAHRASRTVYVETSPHSGLEELDFARQAAHFVAEACVACTAPVYQEAGRIHLAQRVAMYCRMARTCANIGHEADTVDFSVAERATTQLVNDQYLALASYITEEK